VQVSARTRPPGQPACHAVTAETAWSPAGCKGCRGTRSQARPSTPFRVDRVHHRALGSRPPFPAVDHHGLHRPALSLHKEAPVAHRPVILTPDSHATVLPDHVLPAGRRSQSQYRRIGLPRTPGGRTAARAGRAATPAAWRRGRPRGRGQGRHADSDGGHPTGLSRARASERGPSARAQNIRSRGAMTITPTCRHSRHNGGYACARSTQANYAS